jgi:hypothetical protein
MALRSPCSDVILDPLPPGAGAEAHGWGNTNDGPARTHQHPSALFHSNTCFGTAEKYANWRPCISPAAKSRSYPRPVSNTDLDTYSGERHGAPRWLCRKRGMREGPLQECLGSE